MFCLFSCKSCHIFLCLHYFVCLRVASFSMFSHRHFSACICIIFLVLRLLFEASKATAITAFRIGFPMWLQLPLLCFLSPLSHNSLQENPPQHREPHPGSRGPLTYCRREYQSLHWFRRLFFFSALRASLTRLRRVARSLRSQKKKK